MISGEEQWFLFVVLNFQTIAHSLGTSITFPFGFCHLIRATKMRFQWLQLASRNEIKQRLVDLHERVIISLGFLNPNKPYLKYFHIVDGSDEFLYTPNV